MRAIIQRVTQADVQVDEKVVGAIGPGLCILLGVGPNDTDEIARHLADRIAHLRIHADSDDKMNQDLIAVGGEALVVSQFTLYADTSRGHRPSFVKAGPPQLGEKLCTTFVDALREAGLRVATGQFAARMKVSLVNDGPITIALSSGESDWDTDAG